MTDTASKPRAEISGLPELLRAPAQRWLDRLLDSGVSEEEDVMFEWHFQGFFGGKI